MPQERSASAFESLADFYKPVGQERADTVAGLRLRRIIRHSHLLGLEQRSGSFALAPGQDVKALPIPEVMYVRSPSDLRKRSRVETLFGRNGASVQNSLCTRAFCGKRLG